MSATVVTSLETVTASEVTIAFEAFLKTSVTVIAFVLSFICLVCPVLIVLFVLVRLIISKSSDKELL
jgi:hypothetical protein